MGDSSVSDEGFPLTGNNDGTLGSVETMSLFLSKSEEKTGGVNRTPCWVKPEFAAKTLNQIPKRTFAARTSKRFVQKFSGRQGTRLMGRGIVRGGDGGTGTTMPGKYRQRIITHKTQQGKIFDEKE